MDCRKYLEWHKKLLNPEGNNTQKEKTLFTVSCLEIKSAPNGNGSVLLKRMFGNMK